MSRRLPYEFQKKAVDGSKVFWLARSIENLSDQKVVRKWQTSR